ncbi:hypothetical protein [Saccharopolyspora hattusasensis]|uniref:hypothetical protein n=1 Tax=Saccharopolyspora hattusasensis TaxID=1128679 RepID=UPI003D97EBF4
MSVFGCHSAQKRSRHPRNSPGATLHRRRPKQRRLALPTSRIAFAHTNNKALRSALAHYRTMLSYGRVPQGDELTAAAAICLTPQHWIDRWDRTYAQRVDRLCTRVQPSTETSA